MKKQSRITEIDVLKGIGMLLVIFQHCIGVAGAVDSDVSRIVLAFHMPLFFFASGMLISKRNISDTLSKKTATLLAPVVFYSAINAMIRSILHLVSKDDLYSVFCFAGFWFLLSLLYINIIDYAIQKHLENMAKIFATKSGKIIIGIAVSAFGLYFSQQISGKEVTIATALVGYGFYTLGSAMSQLIISYIGNDKLNTKRIVCFLIGTFMFALLIILSRFNTNVYMYQSEYGNPFFFMVNAFIGIFGSIFIAIAIKHNILLEFFGKNSLVILITHFPVHHICCKLGTLLFSSVSIWLVAFAGFTMTCIIEYAVVLVVNRYLPCFTGKIVLKEN
jgi:fucose 4-O-acetylase-like acetyltransferase